MEKRCYREQFPHLLVSALSFSSSEKIDTRAATEQIAHSAVCITSAVLVVVPVQVEIVQTGKHRDNQENIARSSKRTDLSL